MSELHTLAELAAGSTGGREYIEAGLARLPAGELHADGLAAAVLDAAAPLIAARTRTQALAEAEQEITAEARRMGLDLHGPPDSLLTIPAIRTLRRLARAHTTEEDPDA